MVVDAYNAAVPPGRPVGISRKRWRQLWKASRWVSFRSERHQMMDRRKERRAILVLKQLLARLHRLDLD